MNGLGRQAGSEHWYRSHVSPGALTPVHGPMRSSRATVATMAAQRAPMPAVRPAAASAAARSRTIRRRRDVLSALLVAVVATLALGLLFHMGIMLLANLVSDVLLVAYVALLVRQRNAAAERDMKVRFLPQGRRLDPALLRAEPALLRRSAN
jgi:hypothetical protein